MNKILKVALTILFFSFCKSYAVENVDNFTDAINKVRNEFNNISEASLIPDVSGQLALKLFQEIDDIDTIFIQSNMVTINFQRNIGNDTSNVEDTLQNFFIFYGEEE